MHTKFSYRKDLFDPSHLNTLTNIQNALFELEGVFTETHVEQLLSDMLSLDTRARVVELVLSNLSDRVPLTQWLLSNFPKFANDFFQSPTSKLLERLSFFFLFPPLPFPSEEIEQQFKTQYQAVSAAAVVLRTLPALTFVDVDNARSHDNSPALSRSTKAKARNKRREKVEKRNTERDVIDTKPFDVLNVSVPKSKQDRDNVMTVVLTHQREILEFYLDALRLPDMAKAIMETFLLSDDTLQLTIPSALPDVEDSEDSVDTEITAPTPVVSAYPAIQPLKTALIFDSADGFGDWTLLVSQQAHGDLRDARRRDMKIFKIIYKKMKELSNGYFSDDNQKRLNGSNVEIPIYEAKMTRDLRLVYQVDCAPDNDNNSEKQVLRVFGIYTHAQLRYRFWDSLGRELANKGKEYKARCIFRTHFVRQGEKVYQPASFPILPETTLTQSTALDLPPDDLKEIHSLLVLEKFTPFSKAFLNSILGDFDVTLPFQVSAKERTIIEHPYSSYVIGRSGTGKTTTMLFKILLIERSYLMRGDNGIKPRQLFVTKSRVLAGKVEDYFMQLLESLHRVSIPADRSSPLSDSRPIVKNTELVDIDDIPDWRSDLPQKFSDLSNRHFPLFITFERLCQMIENDIRDLEASRSNDDTGSDSGICDLDTIFSSGALKATGELITFDLFLQEYWSHFPQTLIKGLDASLVFGEILGVILGSEGAISSHLNREVYENLSDRTHSTFNGRRRAVYDIFDSYLIKKKQRGDYDVADRTRAMISVLRKRFVGTKIDYLYVDEAQDNLLIDALLLRFLCRNPNGLFWAGDTAQTIAVGSSFRFDDLKAFLYRIEQRRVTDGTLWFQAQKSLRTFELNVNYRSHAGIVNCAHAVIELITRFWPYSIDTLAAEKGIVNGFKPIFFTGWEESNIQLGQFLFGSSGSPVEFGAQQCILVRDDAAREELLKRFGKVALIMTLYESKGLEFNDILLYNFFHDSTADLTQWRVVLNAIEGAQGCIQAPRFNDAKHAAICSELKFLYVAITRARQNLWIADCSIKGEPMREFWLSRNQVQSFTPDILRNVDSGASSTHFAVPSQGREWAKQGKQLFERQKWAQAKHCYERAFMPREAAIADAYHLREEARKTLQSGSSHSLETQLQNFSKAGKAFVSCAEDASLSSRTAYYRTAGNCFELGQEVLKAAQFYRMGDDYDSAAKMYRKLGKFDEAVEIIKAHRDQMHSDVVANITDIAYHVYSKTREEHKVRELFKSQTEELLYLEDRDLNLARRAEILESINGPVEAANLLLTEDRYTDAISILLRDPHAPGVSALAFQCIFRALWDEIPPLGSRNEASPEFMRLLQLSSSLDISCLDDDDLEQLKMLRLFASGEQLAAFGMPFYRQEKKAAALLCFENHFFEFSILKNKPLDLVADIVHAFLAYTRILFDLALHEDPSDLDHPMRRLFGFSKSPDVDDQFVVNSRSILYDEAVNIRASKSGISVNITLQKSELKIVFQKVLQTRLLDRVARENDVLRTVQSLLPCLPYAVFGKCARMYCTQEHLPAALFTVRWYNLRIQVIIHQILIYQTVKFVQFSNEFRAQRRYWIESLYFAMYPPHEMLGSFCNFNPESIPEIERGMKTIKEWIQDIVVALDISKGPEFLTDAIRAIHLGYFFDKKGADAYMLRSLPLASENYKNEATMISDVLALFSDNEAWSLSAGVRLFSHVVEFDIPIDIQVLCILLEKLVGSLIVCRQYQRHEHLHDTMLPRSWLLQSTNGFHPEVAILKETYQFRRLIQPLKILMNRLYFYQDTDSLRYLEQNAFLGGHQTRSVFISRICRSMSLLGYHGWAAMQGEIMHAFTSLHFAKHHGFSRIYARYIFAESWYDVVKALRRSMLGALADEMVQLKHSSRVTERPGNILGLNRLVFTKMEDIPFLLAQTSTAPRGLAPLQTFISESHPVLSIKTENTIHDADEETESITDTSSNGDEESETGLERVIPQIAAVSLSPKELAAAELIFNYYRRHLNQSQKNSHNRSATGVQRIFVTCLEETRKALWDHTPYRVYYLGPLPNLLQCLKVAHETLLAYKTQVKKALTSATHDRIDKLSAELTLVVSNIRKVKHSQQILDPSAEIHRSQARDIHRLKKEARIAIEFLRDGRIKLPAGVRKDIDIAFKAFVKEPMPVKKKKPELQMEEDERYYI